MSVDLAGADVLGFAVLCVVGAALAVRDARRARRFLDEHPEPVAEGATER